MDRSITNINLYIYYAVQIKISHKCDERSHRTSHKLIAWSTFFVGAEWWKNKSTFFLFFCCGNYKHVQIAPSTMLAFITLMITSSHIKQSYIFVKRRKMFSDNQASEKLSRMLQYHRDNRQWSTSKFWEIVCSKIPTDLNAWIKIVLNCNGCTNQTIRIDREGDS